MPTNFIKVGCVSKHILKNINSVLGYKKLPENYDVDVVLDVNWFVSHIEKHYSQITQDQAINKVKRILKNANHILYGMKKNGVLYIEMNSVNKEIAILKFSSSHNNFRVDTTYPFSSHKLVSLCRSTDVQDVS